MVKIINITKETYMAYAIKFQQTDDHPKKSYEVLDAPTDKVIGLIDFVDYSGTPAGYFFIPAAGEMFDDCDLAEIRSFIKFIKKKQKNGT